MGSDSGLLLLWAYRTFDALPAKCQKYIERIEEVVGVPIKYIGVGPEVAPPALSLALFIDDTSLSRSLYRCYLLRPRSLSGSLSL